MKTFMRLLCEICVAAILLGVPIANAVEAPAAAPTVAEAGGHQALVLQAGNGKVVTLKGSATNIFVADPKVAEVRPASASTLFVFGIAAGNTTVAAMDSAGHVLVQYDLTVQPSAYGAQSAEAMIARLLPGSRVEVHPQSKGLLLTGFVSSPQDAAQAVAIAKDYAGDTPAVDNQISIMAPVQVTLNVRIAEMSRTVVRDLGINWQALGSLTSGWQLGFTTPASLTASAASGLLAGSIANTTANHTFNASSVIDALAQDNLARMLAEPNLTVMSGQTASFQVGGEFPIPISETNGALSIDFKDYGILLSFLPTVMSDGRINIHVKPEVSELDKADGIQLTAGNSSVVVPALTVRRAESTVELGSGQSFAIAGLLQQASSQNTSGLPGLGDTPFLGALFRSNGFQKSEDELVIVVTPYIVRPVNHPADLHLPTDGTTEPTDLERLLLLRQVADKHAAVPVRIPGDAGFMVQ
jgi:pilus assembly protein CpaC